MAVLSIKFIKNEVKMRVVQYVTNTRLLGLTPNNSEGETVMALLAINVRNQLRGRVKEILWGDVVSEVGVETSAGIITSIISTRSVKELALEKGSEVLALVKATDVAIAKI
jgi:molybdopterin-binding protein